MVEGLWFHLILGEGSHKRFSCDCRKSNNLIMNRSIIWLSKSKRPLKSKYSLEASSFPRIESRIHLVSFNFWEERQNGKEFII